MLNLGLTLEELQWLCDHADRGVLGTTILGKRKAGEQARINGVRRVVGVSMEPLIP